MYFSPADLLLWSRCRRQWQQQCRDESAPLRRWPALPIEMTSEASLREAARVIHTGQRLLAPEAPDAAAAAAAVLQDAPPVAGITWLDEQPEADEWISTSRRLMDEGAEAWNVLLRADALYVLIDAVVWHPRLEGWTLYLFRPATGLRGSYNLEAAMVMHAAEVAGVPVAELQLGYLDKRHHVSSGGAASFGDLFRFSNLTRRAARRGADVGRMVSALRNEAAGAAIPDDYVCSQKCRLCVPDADDSPGRDLDARYSVHTLHKGRQLGQELAAAGVYDLRDVDMATRRFSAKQRIQIESVRSSRVHIDSGLLGGFLGRLDYPLHFLDFEAYAVSTPVFEGLAPYEHMPVIASLHRRTEPGAATTQLGFAMTPGTDQRREFFTWLEEHLGDQGSVIVFSKGFEAGMVRQLAARAGREDAGAAMIARMVDLLEPFAGFAVYHPDQLGKVSLKRVLPAFTDADYGESPLKDGMHANLGYTRRADEALASNGPEPAAGAARAAEAVSQAIDRFGRRPAGAAVSVEEISAYCAVDTIAMVHLIDRMSALLAENR